MSVVGGVETTALEVDSHREEKALHRLAADLALLDRLVRNALEALELMITGDTSVFVGWQVSDLLTQNRLQYSKNL